jgi:hypothetical protein
MNPRRFLTLGAIAMSFAFIFSGCSSEATLGPVETVKAFEKVMYEGDYEKAAEYVSGEDASLLESLRSPGDLYEDDPRQKEIAKKLYEAWVYTLISEEANKATVRVAQDLGEIMPEISKGYEGYSATEPMEIDMYYILEKINGKWLITRVIPNLDS